MTFTQEVGERNHLQLISSVYSVEKKKLEKNKKLLHISSPKKLNYHYFLALMLFQKVYILKPVSSQTVLVTIEFHCVDKKK